MVAFIAPLEGIPNLFVAPIHNLDSRKPLTHYNDRGIQARDVSGIVMYKWSSDNQFLLYPTFQIVFVLSMSINDIYQIPQYQL